MRGSKKNGGEPQSSVERIRAIQRSNPANKRCADCTEMGPTYICLDYWTFVCQYCSGIHREFGHKIKGISLSEWAPSEIEELAKGANACTNEAFLARCHNKEALEPDSNDPQVVRDFLRQKYVEKKWWSEPEKAKKMEEARAAAAKAEAAEVAKVKSALAKVEEAKKLVDKVERVQAAPVEDLLGDVAAAAPTPMPVSLAAPPSALAAQAVIPAAPLLEMSPTSLLEMSPAATISSEWTADFSSDQAAAPAGGFPQQQGGLLDLDLSGTGVLEPTALDFSGPAGDGPASGLLGVDFQGGDSASDASALASTSGAPLQGISFPNPAAEEVHATETPGERMRQALLSGKGNEFSKLLDQLQKPEVQASPADRFEALQGNLGNLFSQASPAQAPSPFPMPYVPSQPPLPPHNDMLTLMPPNTQTASSTLPSFMGAPTSEPFPQISGPQHVGDQLARMQGMIATAQIHPSGSKLLSSSNGNSGFSHSFGAPQAVLTSPATPAFEEEPNQENPFGDLLGAFNEKHPINGLGQDGLRILA